MKTQIKKWKLRFGMLAVTSILFTSCAPELFGKIGVECPTLEEILNYDPTDGEGVTRNSSMASDDKTKSDGFITYRAGGVANWPIAEKFTVSSGLFIAGKGGKFENSDFNMEEKVNLTYLDIPIKAHYKIGTTGLNVNAGFQPSFLVGAKNTVNINGIETVTKGTENLNTLDIAVGAGLGYLFENGIMIDAGYDHGLANIVKKGDFGSFERKNRVIYLTLGYQFK